jgi:squalene-hopene/tetraprenyl-beta-curcumene cyclase
MNLIRTLFSRLSESLLSNGSDKFRSAVDYAPASLLRLVSDKPVGLPSLDPSIRRTAGHTATQPDAIDDAIRRSQAWFLSQQHAEGYWVAELEADTTLTSEYVMLRRFLDRVDLNRQEKAVQYLKSMQLPDGGWPIYYGGPSEISASTTSPLP